MLQIFGRVKGEQNDASVQSSQLHQGFKDGRESLEDEQRSAFKDVERGQSERGVACRHLMTDTGKFGLKYPHHPQYDLKTLCVCQQRNQTTTA
jgi:hypothetical protein